MLATIILCFGCVSVGASALHPMMRRLRGGTDADDPESLGLKSAQVTGRMSKDEVVEKLNRVPAFCIMRGDGSLISLPYDGDESSDAECCTWFMDPHEAADTFRKVKAANTGERLSLVAHALGDALQMCGGWPDDEDGEASYDGILRLAPSKAFVEPIETQLEDSLRQAGIAAGTWVVPTFVGEELAQAGPEGEQRALPIFMSPYDLRDAYEKAGALNGKVAQSGPRVLELRMLVQYMLDEPKEYPNAWRAVEFVPTAAAVELARLLAEQSAKA